MFALPEKCRNHYFCRTQLRSKNRTSEKKAKKYSQKTSAKASQFNTWKKESKRRNEVKSLRNPLSLCFEAFCVFVPLRFRRQEPRRHWRKKRPERGSTKKMRKKSSKVFLFKRPDSTIPPRIISNLQSAAPNFALQNQWFQKILTLRGPLINS